MDPATARLLLVAHANALLAGRVPPAPNPSPLAALPTARAAGSASPFKKESVTLASVRLGTPAVTVGWWWRVCALMSAVPKEGLLFIHI